MIGIVILNYKNWQDTRRCVESIAQNPPEDDYKIILVDNASENSPEYDLQDFIKEYGIVFIENPANLGYNAGNNAGIKAALSLDCAYILISNNDVCYFPGSIQMMKDYLKRNPKVGIVGPKVIDREGNVQHDCICRRTGLKEKYLVRTKANVLFRKSHRSYFGLDRDYDKPFAVYSVLGCCFMMSEKCARAVTPFDEHPLLYEEELMLGIRMEQKGFATVYYPKAKIRHLHGASTSGQRAFSFAQNVRSEIYYCKAYLGAGKGQIYPLYLYRILLYLGRCLKYPDFRKKLRWFLGLTKDELDKGIAKT